MQRRLFFSLPGDYLCDVVRISASLYQRHNHFWTVLVTRPGQGSITKLDENYDQGIVFRRLKIHITLFATFAFAPCASSSATIVTFSALAAQISGFATSEPFISAPCASSKRTKGMLLRHAAHLTTPFSSWM